MFYLRARGIGENDAKVRAEICGGLYWMGIILDDVRNRAATNPISDPTSRCAVLVLASQEDQQIARHAAQSNACLDIVGHTSRSGPEPLNERLSQLRAEYIKQRLESEVPQLSNRTIASGKGSRENIVGTGTDNASDALDRRVEFKVIGCEAT